VQAGRRCEVVPNYTYRIAHLASWYASQHILSRCPSAEIGRCCCGGHQMTTGSHPVRSPSSLSEQYVMIRTTYSRPPLTYMRSVSHVIDVTVTWWRARHVQVSGCDSDSVHGNRVVKEALASSRRTDVSTRLKSTSPSSLSSSSSNNFAHKRNAMLLFTSAAVCGFRSFSL